MRQVTLSDHAGDKGQAAANKRQTDFLIAKEQYVMAMNARQDKANVLREQSQTVFRGGKYFSWLISLFPRIKHAMSSKPHKPTIAEASREEVVWNAGSDGERRVADALRNELSDEWVLVSGYRNSGGEIDGLLIGPLGILAIEIKFVNGVVYCNGDKWWRDKYDRYGNLVETSIAIADKRGRGPSAQVNTAADRLQSFLSKRSSLQRVSRAVILSHDSSEIGQISNPTVDLIATLTQLNANVITAALPGNLGGNNTNDIVQLIRKDHEYHKKPHDTRQYNHGKTRYANGKAGEVPVG